MTSGWRKRQRSEDDDTQDYVRPWVELTDEEIGQLAVDAGIITWLMKSYNDTARKFSELPMDEGMDGDSISLRQFARLICAMLKERNT